MSRGIRQGCPISALLYLFVSEILALKINKNENIQGFQLSNLHKEFKTAQHADDLTVMLRNIMSLSHALDTIKEFCKHAGSKVNIEKTECILLGPLKENFNNTFNIKVNTTCLKCLGIYLGHDKDECFKRNWENTMKDMEKLFESWKKRKLTIFGKCEIINTLAISKLIYIASILPLPPPYFIKDVNKLIYSFLWSSRDRIKRNTLIGPIRSGGIGLVDIETKLKALKASWVSRLYNDTGNIKDFLTDILCKHSMSFNYILKCNETKNIMSFLPTFYEQVFVCFNECKKLTPLHNLSTCSFFQQPIWMNRYFKYRDKTLYFSSWIKSNIMYVKDLFTEHGFKTLEEIGGVLRQKQNWLCEYNIVRNVFKRFENMFNFSMCPYVNIRDITSFVFVTKYDTFCRKKCNNLLSHASKKQIYIALL